MDALTLPNVDRCESCGDGPPQLAVPFDDTVFHVCWRCRPMLVDDTDLVGLTAASLS